MENDIATQQSSYVSKSNKAFKWCYRRKLGTFPKSWLSPIKKVSRFIVKTLLRHRIEFIARGRGSRVEIAKQLNRYARAFDQDLPIKYAKRAAIYVSIYRR